MLSVHKHTTDSNHLKSTLTISVPIWLLALSLLLGISACGGNGESNNDDNGTTNTAPVANAGADQNVSSGAEVSLNASSSSDADGDTLTYNWSFTSTPANSSATLTNATGVSATFTADEVGNYVVQLVVNDGQVNSSADTVTITASSVQTNTAPVANAGSDQAVTTGTLITLDGSGSSDTDGDSLTYSWTFTSIPTGSAAALNDSTVVSPNFNADIAGSYSLQLVVNDGVLDSSADSVTVVATDPGMNTSPEANAGNDKHTYTDNLLTFDGSSSTDADGDTLTYSWTLDDKPASSSATLANETTSTPSLTPDVEGSYVISLVVNDGQANSAADTVIINAARWWVNNSTRSTYIQESGQGVLVNVQSVATSTQNNQEFIAFNATGIPNYAVTMTQDDIDTLNNRPNAASDFRTPSDQTTAQVGDVVEFGQDIGYKLAPGCTLGYWPPGPECPSNQSTASIIPTEPEPATQTCNAGVNSIGVMLNGTSVFNWDDGSSYNNQNIWNNLAPKFEIYDVDICLGHAQQQGNYHHHMFSRCLQDLMGDDGSSHSPIYGFAADGYPIYGPYFAQNILAKSAWVARDYNDVNSASGCGVAGSRTCQLVDQYDITQGTTSVTAGPTTSDSVTSQSGNSIDASDGIYFEDFYYDASLTAMDGAYLDEHNGHTHDNLGYHYHITVEDSAGSLTPVFPYQVGPTFYGKLPSGGIANCQ